MTAVAPFIPGFRRRLAGGVYGSVTDARRADHGFLDDRALDAHWPQGEFGELAAIRDERWSLDAASETIVRLTERLSGSPELLTAVVLAPDKALDRLLTGSGPVGSGPLGAWVGMCWTSEAAWAAVTGGPAAPGPSRDRPRRWRPGRRFRGPGAPGLGAELAARLRPLAARLRFLVLSEPMRWRGPGWDWGADERFGGSGVFGRALGPSSWGLLVDRCREARAEWQGCLDAYQDHQLLRHASPVGLEDELRLVLFADGRSRPLALSAVPLAERAPLTSEDREVIAVAVERHLLPRFAMGAVVRLTLHDDARGRRLARGVVAGLAAGTGLAAVGCAVALDVRVAVYLTAACYALICAGIWALPAAWGAMWLLRMPAASAVGVVTLVTFLPGGWLESPPRGWNGAGGWHAAALLAVAACGYLLVEVRNHGVAFAAAPLRALTVAFVGLVHALLISLIGLVVVAPAFTRSGWRLHELWARPTYGQAGMVLALATAWCLAFGVFSQILWDDRPITAPLAHLSWRR